MAVVLLSGQAYQIPLDSRFQSQGDQSSSNISGSGGGGQDVTLDVQWWFTPTASDEQATAATATTALANDSRWRLSRGRDGETELSVKEWVGTGEGLSLPIDVDGTMPRDGYRCAM